MFPFYSQLVCFLSTSKDFCRCEEVVIFAVRTEMHTSYSIKHTEFMVVGESWSGPLNAVLVVDLRNVLAEHLLYDKATIDVKVNVSAVVEMM